MTEIITARELLGAEVFLYFDEQGRSHTARMKPENKTRTGEAVRLYFDPERIHLLTVTRKKICFMQRRCDHEYPEEKLSITPYFILYHVCWCLRYSSLSVFKTIFLSLFLTDKMGQAKILWGCRTIWICWLRSLSATV